MTPNTHSLSGLPGLDNAGRPRTSAKQGADGFASVFDTQVRGTQSGAGKPANGGGNPAEKPSAHAASRENKPQAREANDTEQKTRAKDAAEPARKSADAEDDTDTGGNTLQSVNDENGNPLPAAVPDGQEAQVLLAKVPADGEGVVAASDTGDEEASGAELLSLAFTRKTAADASGATAGENSTRPADGLLNALRFSRVMAQERGPMTPVLEQGTSVETLNGMTAFAGREGSGMMPASQASAASQSISVPLNRAGWDQAFSERVVWMTRQNLQEAHIQVTPREMGPIEVRISVQQDQVSVAFAAQNSAARDAIENALPRLREMLAESGLNLAQSDVSQQSPHERGDGRESVGLRGVGRASGEHDDVNAAVQGVTPLAEGRGLVDYFA